MCGIDNFEWQKQLRYYWDLELDNCVVRMSNSLYVYGYEYQGCSPRLVITPLTVIGNLFQISAHSVKTVLPKPFLYDPLARQQFTLRNHGVNVSCNVPDTPQLSLVLIAPIHEWTARLS